MSYSLRQAPNDRFSPFDGPPMPFDLWQQYLPLSDTFEVWRRSAPNLTGRGPTVRKAWLNLLMLEAAEMHEDRDF